MDLAELEDLLQHCFAVALVCGKRGRSLLFVDGGNGVGGIGLSFTPSLGGRFFFGWR